MSKPTQLADPARASGRDGRAPILVTGAPRSGTTFLGTMLAVNRDVCYIYEPMSRLHGLRDVPDPLLYVREGSPVEPLAERMTRDLLAGRGAFRKPSAELPSASRVRALARRALGTEVSLRYRRDVLNPWRRRWLIKDPWAALASEWLHRRIGMQTVVVVRHPVPVVSSYLRLGWDFKVGELVGIDELRADHLEPVVAGLEVSGLDPLASAALVWRIFYRVLGSYLDRNPDMIVVRHEDLCAAPLDVLGGLYAQLGLRLDARARRRILAHTGAGNEVEAAAGRQHQLQRDSAAVATSWRGRVSEADRATIRRWTEPEASRWYTETDW